MEHLKIREDSTQAIWNWLMKDHVWSDEGEEVMKLQLQIEAYVSTLPPEEKFEWPIFRCGEDSSLFFWRYLRRFLTLPIGPYYHLEKGVQTPIMTSLREILLNRVGDDCHRVTYQDTDYGCHFHQESLRAHLVGAMLLTLADYHRRFPESYHANRSVPLWVALTGLCHDLGRKDTLTLSKYPKIGPVVGFPFHGNYAGGLLQSWYNRSMEPFLSPDQWTLLTRVISLHMCGSRMTEFESREARLKLGLLRMEQPELMPLLISLSYGDQMSAVSKTPMSEEKRTNFLATRGTLLSQLVEPIEWNEFLPTQGLDLGVMLVTGRDQCGKSQRIREMTTYLAGRGFDPSQMQVINRQDAKIRIAQRGVQEAPELMEKFLVPEGEERTSYLGVERPVEELDPPQRARFLQVYADNKSLPKPSRKPWGEQTNRSVSQQFREGVRRGVKLFFLEVSSCYLPWLDQLCPRELASRLLVMTLDLIRTDEITEGEAVCQGQSLEEYLASQHTRPWDSWLPPKSLGSPTNRKLLKELIPRGAAKKPFARTGLSFPHLRIQWGMPERYGLSPTVQHLLNQLEQLSSLPTTTYQSWGEMDLHHRCHTLYHALGYEGLVQDFKERNFDVRPLPELWETPHSGKHPHPEEYLVMRVKYRENCRYWQETSDTQARGTVVVVFLDPTRAPLVIKNLLPRGSELMTRQQTMRDGIQETSDFSLEESARPDHLDRLQLDSFELLQTGASMEGYLSFKKDGMLVGWNLIPNTHPVAPLIRTWILNGWVDPFHQQILEIADEQGIGFTPVLSTQGLLWADAHTFGYLVTALGVHQGIPFAELQRRAETETPMEMMREWLPKILSDLRWFQASMTEEQQKEIICCCFEYLCPERTEAWKDEAGHPVVHHELAISYSEEQCDIRFLAATLGVGRGIGVTYPHFVFPEAVQKAGWREPLYWKVESNEKIDHRLDALTRMLQGTLTQKQFLEEYPPDNLESDPCPVVDFEGFVFYRHAPEEKARPWIYSKIKSTWYYRCHTSKPTTSHLMTMLAFPEKTAQVFPLVAQLKEFYHTFPERWGEMMHQLWRVWDPLFLEEGGIDTTHELLKVFPERAQKGLVGRDRATQRKILINQMPKLGEQMRPIWQSQFPRFRTIEIPDETVTSWTKKLMMKWMPSDDPEKSPNLLDQMHNAVTTQDPLLTELFLWGFQSRLWEV